VSAHQLLSDLLKAFTEQGPGYVSAIATDDGKGTGTLRENLLVQFVVPNWDSDANHILTLPSPKPGKVVILAGAATGGELRTSAPATIGINGGTDTAAESAIAANQRVIAICESSTNWKAFTIASDGTIAGLTAAAA
jgi:hypothetical protein